jgi:Zn-dependent protease with chaperone function
VRELEKLETQAHVDLRLRRYYRGNSLNAFTRPRIPFIEKCHTAYLGDKLISKLQLEEKVSVIAHEIGHILDGHFIKRPLWYAAIVMALYFASLSLNVVFLPRVPIVFLVPSFYLISLSVLLSGVALINSMLWYFEYGADRRSSQLTGNVKPLLSALKKLEASYKDRDYGLILNLILYDHPPLGKRMERLEKTS